ncbi:MAG TPA: hypothetical protein DIT28_13595 [Oxalobacteraceae bacterium]|nr:hypothetical protein [Oxalobacteraceae bacterium]
MTNDPQHEFIILTGSRGLSDLARTLFAVSGLLSSAIRDINPKVGDSSKLARALEDVTAARDAILNAARIA